MPGKPKFLADPCLGAITINNLEYLIINLKIFQRLRWIRQLPSVIFLFHSADHTRFSHSIGTMHIASLYIDGLLKDPQCENPAELEERRPYVRLAGLLHDIAHGIFSHIYDKVVYNNPKMIDYI